MPNRIERPSGQGTVTSGRQRIERPSSASSGIGVRTRLEPPGVSQGPLSVPLTDQFGKTRVDNFLGGLFGDVEKTFTGAIPGIYKVLTSNPIDTAKAIGQTEYQTWRPFVAGYKDLATGDIAGYTKNRDIFNAQFTQHPLGPLLDLTLAGGAAAGRISALSRLGEAPTRADVIQAGVLGNRTGAATTINVGLKGGGTIPTRVVPRNAFRAARTEIVDSLLKKTPGSTPLIGEFHRAARATKNTARTGYLRSITDPRYQAWTKAYGALDRNEKAALKILVRVPLKQDLPAWKKMLEAQTTPEARQLRDILSNPKVVAHYENPTGKMLAAHEAGSALSGLRAETLQRTGALTDAEAIVSPFRHTRILRGAKYLTKSRAYKQLRSVNAELNKLQRKKGRLVKEARVMGTTGIAEAINEGRRLSAEAIKSSAYRARLRGVADQVDAAHAQVSDLRDLVDRVMAGDITLQELQDLRLVPPKTEATSIPLDKPLPQSHGGFTSMETAMHEAVMKKAGIEGAAPGAPDLAAARTRALGILHERYKKAVYNYERAAAAEFGLTREALRAPRIAEAQRAAAAKVGLAREDRIKLLRGQQARFHDLLDVQLQLHQLADEIKAKTGTLVGGGSAEELAAEIAAAKRPMPFYLPDTVATKEKGRYATPEGSIAAQRVRADVYNSRSVLFRTGLLALHPDELSQAFLRAAKHDFHSEMHQIAMKIARPIPKGDGLPDGYEWLKRKPGEHIPQSERARGEHLRQTEDVYGSRTEDLTSKDLSFEDIQKDPKGYRLAVPKAYADEFRAQTVNSNAWMRKVIEAPTDVWRALILHLRIPWLINNVFGNTMLFALRFAGAGGARAFLQMLYDTKGGRAVQRVLDLPETKAALTAEDIQQLLPEQIRGTFIGTQLPPSLVRNAPEKVQKAARVPGAILGALPRVDRATEAALRKAASNAVLHGSPEVRAVFKAMPKETRSWREASKQALQNDPVLRDRVVREVNDALGNFLSLTRHERNVIRRLVPFYAWIREISRIAGRLAIDHPGRALILVQLGRVGAEISPQDVPSYLKGVIPTGQQGDIVSGISTHAASPFTTVTDLARAGKALGPGATAEEKRAFYQNLNPYITQFGVSLFGDRTGKGLAVDPFLETFNTLPQTRAIRNKRSDLYVDRTRLDQLLRYLGDPRVKYDQGVASFYNQEGR